MVALIGKQNVTTFTSIFDTSTNTSLFNTSSANNILPVVTQTSAPYLSSRDIEQSSLLLAQHSGASESNLTSYYDPSSGSLTITETIAMSEIGARTVLTSCFYIEKSIWQGKIPNLKTVTVNIIVPVSNDVTSTLAICTLNKNTEQRFDWDTLNPGQVWEAYNYTWILPSLIQ
jgi:hypothetical protein